LDRLSLAVFTLFTFAVCLPSLGEKHGGGRSSRTEGEGWGATKVFEPPQGIFPAQVELGSEKTFNKLVQATAKRICGGEIIARESTKAILEKALALYELEENFLSQVRDVNNEGSLDGFKAGVRAANHLVLSEARSSPVGGLLESASKRWKLLGEIQSVPLPDRDFDPAKEEVNEFVFLYWLWSSSLGKWVHSEFILNACPDFFIRQHPELEELAFIRAFMKEEPRQTEELVKYLRRVEEFGLRLPLPLKESNPFRALLAKALSQVGLAKINQIRRVDSGRPWRTLPEPWTEVAVLVGERKWLEHVPWSRREQVAEFLQAPEFTVGFSGLGVFNDAKTIQELLGDDGVRDLIARSKENIAPLPSAESSGPTNRDVLIWVSAKETLPSDRLRKLMKWVNLLPKSQREAVGGKAMLAQFIRNEFPKAVPGTIPLDARILDLAHRCKTAPTGSMQSMQDWQSATDDALSILPPSAFHEFLEKNDFSVDQRKYMLVRQAVFQRGLHISTFKRLLEDRESFDRSEYLPYHPELKQSLENALGQKAPPELASVDLPESHGGMWSVYAAWIKKSTLLECLGNPKVTPFISPATAKYYEKIGRSTYAQPPKGK
jgi:hypothetical protein